MKSIIIGSILFGLIAVYTPLDAASADNLIASEVFKISVDLPEDRWEKIKEENNSFKFHGRYSDKRQSADFTFLAASRKPKGFENWVKGWLTRSLRTYSGQYGYSVVDDDEHQAILGSGKTVTFHTLLLEINGQFRTVSYMAFTYQDDVRYFYVFSWPNGDRNHSKKNMELFAKNINLF